MRVIEPSQLQHVAKKKKSKRPKVLAVIGVLLVAGGVFAYWLVVLKPSPAKPTSYEVLSGTTSQPSSSPSQQKVSANTTLKNFTAAEFKALYASTAYPNNDLLTIPPAITGNPDADAQIRKIAEKRGYTLKSVPVAPITKTNEPGLEGDDLLQPLAMQAWATLKANAKKDGIGLKLNSGYRSIEYQRNLFLERLQAKGGNISAIASGENLGAVEGVLLITAPPGYSRHHTGYTVDLWCLDGSATFVASSCFSWMSKDNYKHTKEAGWIPSYPDGAEVQGPEPEPWEYVWVGTASLYN